MVIKMTSSTPYKVMVRDHVR